MQCLDNFLASFDAGDREHRAPGSDLAARLRRPSCPCGAGFRAPGAVQGQCPGVKVDLDRWARMSPGSALTTQIW